MARFGTAAACAEDAVTLRFRHVHPSRGHRSCRVVGGPPRRQSRRRPDAVPWLRGCDSSGGAGPHRSRRPQHLGRRRRGSRWIRSRAVWPSARWLGRRSRPGATSAEAEVRLRRSATPLERRMCAVSGRFLSQFRPSGDTAELRRSFRVVRYEVHLDCLGAGVVAGLDQFLAHADDLVLEAVRGLGR